MEGRGDIERGPRLAFAAVLVVLVVMYAASLAPDITLWDAGEFNAAVASLGIPHPPGTPLFIVIGRAWSSALGFLPSAVAMNLLSALATALAVAILARALARWTGNTWAGVAGGIAAGGMFAVWQNATETEVYALSMLLGVLFVAVGERAGVHDSARHRALLAYLLALAIPVQISALVAAPAAVYLAATPPGGRMRWRTAFSLGSVLILVIGAGLVAPMLMIAGVAMLAVSLLVSTGEPRRRRAATAVAFLAVAMVGATATLFMFVRAVHDPGINQGDPSTWSRFVDVVARRQYVLPPLWPRRAPFWLQIGNFFQYSDWQIAFGLDNSVAASWLRTPWSVAFGALSVAGARWHWRRDRRSAVGMLLLLAGASLGVIAVLNLRAGPTIGIGVLPVDAGHEPRERDYFFALAFAVAGLWAGAGAVLLAVWLSRGRQIVGAVAAALPFVLNWGMADRRREPDASIPPVFGTELLQSSPANAVLFLAGDNDSYSVWYQQQAHGLRTDVTPVTIPLLGATWYRAELARRDSLLDAVDVERWAGEAQTLATIARRARAAGRPVAAALSVSAGTRQALGERWILYGLVYRDGAADAALGDAETESVDSSAVRASADRVAARIPNFARDGRDGTTRYVQRLLKCPSLALARPESSGAAASDSLDSRCNLK